MIANYWPAWFRDLYGSKWPTTYCCFDIETTGFSPEHELVIEWGHCLVENGRPIEHSSFLIDWSKHPSVSEKALKDRLTKLHESMPSAKITFERLKEQGIHPDQFLSFLPEFVNTLIDSGCYFVSHNGYMFDEPFLLRMLSRYGAPAFSFGDNRMFDTAALEKASQLVATHPSVIPKEGDSLRSYFKRVVQLRVKGVLSNLANHCFDKYAFDQHGLAKSDMHGAKDDSFCCHLLMEVFKPTSTLSVVTKKKKQRFS